MAGGWIYDFIGAAIGSIGWLDVDFEGLDIQGFHQNESQMMLSLKGS